jgi:hypothetical protein
MKLEEPTTTITDYLLAIEIIVLGVMLLRHNSSLTGKLWATSFFTLAVAATAGGTYHGFAQALSAEVAQKLWKITLFSIGGATLFMLFAAFLFYIPSPWKNALLILTVVQFILYLIVVSRSDDFRYVIYNYVPAMSAIFLMAVFHKNLWLVGAVVISFIAAAVQRSGIVLHKHFNFNDLYHLIQMVGMYFFYRGGRLL